MSFLDLSTPDRETPGARSSAKRSLGVLVLGASALALLPLGCSEIPEFFAGDGLGGGNGGPNLGGRSGLGPDILGCAEECGEDEFCSILGQCIAEGSCLDDGDCGEAQICSDGVCELGSECGAEKFEIEGVPPNLMFLLDRSCSMPYCADYDLADGNLGDGKGCWNTTGVDKWGLSVQVINELTQEYADKIRWGLELFPDRDGGSCEQGEPQILPGEDNGAAIRGLLTDALDVDDEYFPITPCVTNINGVVTHATGLSALQDADRDNYMILLTDGEEWGCGENNNDATIAALNADTEARLSTAADEGLQTFVIGFGAGVDEDALDGFATAGGVPNAADADRDYFQADNAAELQSQLEDILGSIATCDFTLSKPATSLERLVVFKDGDELTLNADNGYSVSDDRMTLTFLGDTCEEIKSPTPPVIDVIFECPSNIK